MFFLCIYLFFCLATAYFQNLFVLSIHPSIHHSLLSLSIHRWGGVLLRSLGGWNYTVAADFQSLLRQGTFTFVGSLASPGDAIPWPGADGAVMWPKESTAAVDGCSSPQFFVGHGGENWCLWQVYDRFTWVNHRFWPIPTWSIRVKKILVSFETVFGSRTSCEALPSFAPKAPA